MSSVEEWDEQAVQLLNLEDMDNLIKEMREARIKYEDKKKESTELYKEYQELETKAMQALEAAGKKSYKVDGLGNFSIVVKQVVTTPKTIEEKRELFRWIQDKHGKDYLTSMVSINHQKLNSFYNESFKESSDKASFKIDGLEEPTARKETRFRSA